jgi:hypothetical protein
MLTEGCHVSGAARSRLVVRWGWTARTHESDGEHGRGREDAKYSTVAINVAANRFGARGLQVESCKMRMGGRHYTLDICTSGHSNSTRANATSASSPVSSLHRPFSSSPTRCIHTPCRRPPMLRHHGREKLGRVTRTRSYGCGGCGGGCACTGCG